MDDYFKIGLDILGLKNIQRFLETPKCTRPNNAGNCQAIEHPRPASETTKTAKFLIHSQLVFT
jgi:hypothetical protein